MADPNLGQLAASVWSNVIGTKPTDQIRGSLALLYLLGEKGFKEDCSGGATADFTIEYSNNPSFVSVGEFETLDTTRYDVFDTLQYPWKINAGTVVYSELEKLRAQASSRKFDVLAEKLNNGKNSHLATMNVQFYGDGTGNAGKDFDGLTKLIPTSPVTGIVGGINRATFSWHRSQTTSGVKTTATYDNLRNAMRSSYNKQSRGGVLSQPTAWICARATFEGYEGLLIAGERYLMDKAVHGANSGFDNDALLFKGAKGLYDEDCSPADSLYMFSNEGLKLPYLSGGWMKMYPAVDPSNQLSNVHKVATFANLATPNSRRLGVVYTCAS